MKNIIEPVGLGWRDKTEHHCNFEACNLARSPEGSKTDSLEPTKTSKSLDSNWSYRTGSIVAASIFTAITAAAILFLVVLFIQRLRRRWRQNSSIRDSRGSNTNSTMEKRRKRENLMFSENSSRTYVVEQNNGSVTRVVCATPHGSSSTPTPDTTPTRDTIATTTLDETNSSPVNIKFEAASPLDALNSSRKGRSGSIPKPIVIVSPPLEPVVSRSAVPILQSTEAPAPSATEPVHTEQPVETSNSSRFLRLPSLKKTVSPFFRF
ncbi:hypothetical protein P175DRAFT_0529548 [Aspergillus ochraceoroseus IBT 24754]|uniref:Uncharacterized protein n=1 Tax=Aspergillus ochraceoroseus IBT 24754 TaxID=1392256 RepID=A0A2T5M1U0_9EURO|nr:uncharacterized protein P175DRAFT_0529548 [Aspergillus ochraceoroseus IBT 24754]PTU22488.1 hypothetical protein P175DRAFT_0529548 [Aspergillus ochraceoroseus IBT 24754]